MALSSPDTRSGNFLARIAENFRDGSKASLCTHMRSGFRER
jgi:hypothetical protein